MEKTLITHLKTERARFLGYEINSAQDNNKLTKNDRGKKVRSINGRIQLLVPNDVINEKIKRYTKNGKSDAYTARVNKPVLDIINEFNAEIRGLYNYYSLATDVSRKMNKLKYYHYYSLLKTIARKEKSSVKKVIKKYGVDVPRKQGRGTIKIIGVTYKTKNGEKTMTYFNERIIRVKSPKINIEESYTPLTRHSKLIDRINAQKCEICGCEKNIEVHHIRKLKDIKDKYKKRGTKMPNWVFTMARMNRKTLIVCNDCHNKIHAGTI